MAEGQEEAFLDEESLPTTFADEHSTGFTDEQSTAYEDDHSTAYVDEHSTAYVDEHSTAYADEHSTAYPDEQSTAYADEQSTTFADEDMGILGEEQGTGFEEEQLPDDSEVSVLSLNEILQYEDQLMEDTAAVLGAMNDKSCSYAEGYVKRQALYSCLTCIPETASDVNRRAGVCLACSYHCHEGHEMIELYTKRNFRCDCGNSKFESTKCNLLPDKDLLNEENNYNQNFQGSYCVCRRPYPDPEDPISDEMIQCIICEDWYHSRHLNVPLPLTPFIEMVCFNCVGDHPFLLHYAESNNCKSQDDGSPNKNNSPEEDPLDIESHSLSENKILDENSTEIGDCKKPKKRREEVSTMFWSDVSWRKSLCTCDLCLEMYGDENVLFLVDPEDPVQLYEERGKAKTQEIIDNQDKKLLGSMNRVQLIETIAGYNELKNSLGDFLRGFAEKREVVQEKDVREFFEQMQAKKKRKIEIPYYCK